MIWSQRTYAAVLVLAGASCIAAACSVDTTDKGINQGTAGAPSSPGAGGDLNIGEGGGGAGPGIDPETACAMTSAEAVLTKKPVDVIFLVDNSSSMQDNIVSTQNNINDSFTAIIGASGIDYRVIMVSQHGKAEGIQAICVKAPLSQTSCDPVPPEPAQNPPIFFHYSLVIDSHDSICRFMDAYDATKPDQFHLAPDGLSAWLRPDALKVFVGLTDDSLSCDGFNDLNTKEGGAAAAQKVDAALLALDPTQFGDKKKRGYVFHSIVGVKENNPKTAAYLPEDPIEQNHCSTAVSAGTGYQALSRLTGGLRFPICQFKSFDVVFKEIAKGIVLGAKLSCEFPVPKPPAGQTIDLDTVAVQYMPGGSQDAQSFQQAKSPLECAASSFYIDGETIKLCPETCAAVEDDGAAKLTILYSCEEIVK